MSVAKPLSTFLKIGDVARRSGFSVEALRFYERAGLIEPSERTAAGYRLFSEAIFERLVFIRKAQSVGFSLDEIAHLIRESRDGRRPCAEVRRLARERLRRLDERIAELNRCREELRETVEAWDRRGSADGVICGLIEGLAPDRRPLEEAL